MKGTLQTLQKPSRSSMTQISPMTTSQCSVPLSQCEGPSLSSGPKILTLSIPNPISNVSIDLTHLHLVLTSMDAKYLATKRHFSELFERYSYPLYCINLTKAKNARECTVSDQYKHVANEVLNRELPQNMRIKYIHYDMKIRKKEQGFPNSLHQIVKPFIKRTGIFTCTRNKMSDSMSQIDVQRGVIRTNCIDSLDRTNEAQCFIGMYVLKKQLRKLGIILKSSEVKAASPLGIQFKNLFDDHGDLISLQYGGSKAHHSNLTKKKNFFQNVIPELVTSMKRHYANNFLDPQRQLIINLYLGLYKPIEHEQ